MKRVVGALIVLGLLTGGAFALSILFVQLPNINDFGERRVSQSTKIYDRTGKIVLYDIHGEENRTIVSFDEIPAHVKNATIALEDDTFYTHRGIRPLSIVRAVLKNVFFGSSEGGSTITQQLVKSVFLTPEKSILRKIKEWVIALKLERQLSKDEILGLYLNQIPYGSGAYGIEAAAETFFSKHAKDLTLAESAYLVSLPNAPTFYSPYGKNKDKLIVRARFALLRMKEVGLLSEEEYERALNEEVEFAPPKQYGIFAPHFVLEVREKINELFGEDAVERSGYSVITTLDAALQQKSEEVLLSYAESNAKNYNSNNASMVAIDPATGDILAMVGSKNYFGKATPEGCAPGVNCSFDPQVNVAVRYRQPGSAFKPFVYATAFKKGLTPETVVFDLKTEFNTSCNSNGTPAPGGDPEKCYHPGNFDNIFRGPISLREALAQSLNVPSVKTLYLAGLNDSLRTARDFGISTLNEPDRYGLTLVLGGGEVSLLELASAYGVFAHDGVRNPHRDILEIKDARGKIVYKAENNSREVIEKNIARTISSILSDNVARTPAFGEFSALYFPGRDVAAKTGTTNDYRDAWIIGYTPSIVIGTWAGNSDNSEMEKRVAGFIVAPMWHEIMEYALINYPGGNFPSAQKLPAAKPILRGEWRGGIEYVIDTISGKLATEFTPESTKEKKVVQEVHSILYWLDPNSSQLKNWESVVREWAQKNGFVDGDRSVIPTEYDDVHTSEKFPYVTTVVVTPQKNVYEEDEVVVVRPMFGGTYPLIQVDYFLNNEYRGSTKTGSFEKTIQLKKDFEKNSATLKVKIYDAVQNTAEYATTIQLTN